MRIIAQPAFDSRNPYTRNLYRHLQRLEGVNVDEFSLGSLLFNHYDVWHRHWPERSLNQRNFVLVFIKLMAALLCTIIAKLKGTKIIWTVHNLHSHEQYYPRLETQFWRFFIGSLDGYLCLSQRSQQLAIQRFPGLNQLPGEVVYHPHYRENYVNQGDPIQARYRLGIGRDKTVLLLLGQLRAYKNIPAFIELFRQNPDPQLVLCIAGKPAHDDLADEIRTAAQGDSRIKLYLDYVPDEQVEHFMNAADLVVAPYREILNSGAVLLALSFNRPFLSPAMGSVREMANVVGDAWAFTYTAPLDSDTLARAIAWSSQKRSSSAPLDNFSPEAIAKETLKAYGRFLSQGHQTQNRPPSLEVGMKRWS